MLTFITIWGGHGTPQMLFLSCLTSIRKAREGGSAAKREGGAGGLGNQQWGRIVTEWLSGGRMGAKGRNTFMGVS